MAPKCALECLLPFLTILMSRGSSFSPFQIWLPCYLPHEKTILISKTYQVAEWSGKKFYISSYSTTSFSLLWLRQGRKLSLAAASSLLLLPLFVWLSPLLSNSTDIYRRAVEGTSCLRGWAKVPAMVGLASLWDTWICHGGTMSLWFRSGTAMSCKRAWQGVFASPLWQGQWKVTAYILKDFLTGWWNHGFLITLFYTFFSSLHSCLCLSNVSFHFIF